MANVQDALDKVKELSDQTELLISALKNPPVAVPPVDTQIIIDAIQKILDSVNETLVTLSAQSIPSDAGFSPPVK